jgi:hypothetical protein
MAILFACARRSAQREGQPISLMLDAHPIDWPRLLALGDRHGVTELLVAPLTRGVLPAPMPADVTQSLAARQLEVTGLNLGRLTQLTQLLTLLERHGVRGAAFKGPTLAAVTYGHLGCRLSNDLDILVDQANIQKASDLMIADGYLPPPRRRRRVGSLIRGLYPAAGRDDTLWPGQANRVPVDVHVQFAYWTLGMRLTSSDLLDRAVRASVAGQDVSTLCPDDLLLVLATHGMMHGWGTVRTVADIDAVAERVTDWDAVVARAQAARMRRPLWVALLVAHRLMRTALPASILASALRDADAIAIVDGIVTRLNDATWIAPVDMGHRDPWFLPFHEHRIDRWRFHARALAYEWALKWPWDVWLDRYHSRDASR